MNLLSSSGSLLCAALLASASLADAAPLGNYSSHATLTTPAAIDLSVWNTPVEKITGPDATAIQADLSALPPGSHRAFAQAHITEGGE